MLTNILRRWWDEPIGVMVPLVALAILIFAPQMPDMFAGMKVGTTNGVTHTEWWHPIGLGAAAALLGLETWYWMRAALLGPLRIDDYGRQHGAGFTQLDISYEWAPRLVLVFAALVALSPVLVAVKIGSDLADIPWVTICGGLLLVALVFLLVWQRQRIHLVRGLRAPAWMWHTRASAIIAAGPLGWGFALLLVAVSCGGSALLALDPAWIERNLHTPIAALIALALAVAPFSLLLALLRDAVWLMGLTVIDRTGPVVNLLGLLLLFVCISVQSIFGERYDLYKVRSLAPLNELRDKCQFEPKQSVALAPAPRPCFDEALWTWAKAKMPPGDNQTPVPVIIVAAEGGASRAAIWLLSAMRLLDGYTAGAFGHYLFAVSGVSGGSFGAVTYLQALSDPALRTESGGLAWDHPRVAAGLVHLGSGDLLVAAVANYFLNDPLGSFLGRLWSADDRGVALEQTFERHWSEQGGFAISHDQATRGLLAIRAMLPSGAPHLFLNGTDEATGRRVITSTVRFSPDDDLFANSDDFLSLYKHDVPAATAVTNSARFPFISPAGRWLDGSEQRQLIDGGYFDNYGARTASDIALRVVALAPKLGIRLVPIVVVVSNDADTARTRDEANERHIPLLEEATVRCQDDGTALEPLPPAVAQARAAQQRRAVLEGLLPLLGLVALRSAHNEDALHILRRQLCGDRDNPRMIHIALPAPQRSPSGGGPPEAAPMNWVLNREACRYLLDVAPALSFNRREAERLRRMLDGSAAVAASPALQCPAG